MATALSNGIYIIDASSQAWLHDPESIDLDNYTEGTDYIYFEKVLGFDPKNAANFEVEDFPGGVGFALPIEERMVGIKWNTIYSGDERATVNKMRHFFNTHTKFSDPQLFLIIKHDTNNYDTFTDTAANDRAIREYCKGIFQSFSSPYDSEEMFYSINAVFRSVW